MSIQINQEFPHCARCGIMLHESQGRFAAVSVTEGKVVLCTQLCRDEYAQLHGFDGEPVWIEGVDAREGKVA